MMTDNKPLNCPCCGSTATVEPHLIEAGVFTADQTWPAWWTASVNCDSCALQFVGEGDTEEEAVEDALEGWNTRAATTDQQFAWAVHDGRTWVCVEAAMESDALKPIPGFTRDSIYRDSMLEYGEWMEKAEALMRDLWSGFECGVAKVCNACPSGAKLGDAPCAIEERLDEFGVGGE